MVHCKHKYEKYTKQYHKHIENGCMVWRKTIGYSVISFRTELWMGLAAPLPTLTLKHKVSFGNHSFNVINWTHSYMWVKRQSYHETIRSVHWKKCVNGPNKRVQKSYHKDYFLATKQLSIFLTIRCTFDHQG